MKRPEIMQQAILRQIEAFRLRYVEKLKLREVGERLGRVDGAGPICTENAQMLVMAGLRRLTHPSRRDHPLHKIALEARALNQTRWRNK